mmetsp:Transcript_8150/g.11742  ORF Transcript_8150/g.11742 Transcript_8150/m.11742 type:complete len:522 (-) Transcript_8150:338-1903(-)
MTTKSISNHLATQLQIGKPHSIPDLQALEGDEKSIDDELIVVEQQNEPCRNVQPPSPYQANHTNICSAQGGSQVLFATDEWFATADNLLQDSPPIFVDDLYCEEGKVMDGWETRRRREAGHDFCIIKLSERSHEAIQAIELDTAHFTGNHVPHISIQVADLTSQQEHSLVSTMPGVLERLLSKGKGVQGTGHTPEEVQQAEDACRKVEWKDLLPYTALNPGYENSRMHYFDLSSGTLQNIQGATHLRVNYYPDGGVARMRVWANPTSVAGEGQISQGQTSQVKKALYAPITTGKSCTVVAHKKNPQEEGSMPSRQEYEYTELSSDKHGGVGLECSNKHYGEPWHLIQPTLGKDMGDGWETARHPERPSILVKDPQTNLVDSDLMDWAILKLGCGGAIDGIQRIILDTKHFRGNYPESVRVEGCFAERGMTDEIVCSSFSSSATEGSSTNGVGPQWFPLLNRTRMAPDSEHVFERTLGQIVNATRAVTHVRVSIFPDGGISRVRIYGDGAMTDDDDAMRSNL